MSSVVETAVVPPPPSRVAQNLLLKALLLARHTAMETILL
jgi:hypothetical protein